MESEEPVGEPDQETTPETKVSRPNLGYESLDPKLVLETIERLEDRIEERFGERSLRGICARLREIGARAAATVDSISKPLIWVRVLTAGLVFTIILGFAATLSSFAVGPSKALTFAEFVQALEAGINDIVLIGAGIFFLVTLENRIKRKRALSAVHELRSLIHIIDMHQLTKDPERLQPDHEVTTSSPGHKLTPFQMNRYLDYCSEMLSLCAKLAALYAQNFADPVVLAAVGEVENLAIGMSGNVWQKITILQSQTGCR